MKLRIGAPPVDGAANEAVVALIARALGAPRSAVRVVAGQTARVKRLELNGVSQADVERAFGLPTV